MILEGDIERFQEAEEFRERVEAMQNEERQERMQRALNNLTRKAPHTLDSMTIREWRKADEIVARLENGEFRDIIAGELYNGYPHSLYPLVRAERLLRIPPVTGTQVTSLIADCVKKITDAYSGIKKLDRLVRAKTAVTSEIFRQSLPDSAKDITNVIREIGEYLISMKELARLGDEERERSLAQEQAARERALSKLTPEEMELLGLARKVEGAR